MRRVISLFQDKKFQQQFPGIGVLKEQDVFVEMQCCSLAIPANARPQEQIDIFSETVLQLADKSDRRADVRGPGFCPIYLHPSERSRIYGRILRLDESGKTASTNAFCGGGKRLG